MSAPFTLYVDAFWCSPFDFSVFVALREKGLEFATARAILRLGQGLPAPLREHTVTGRVPALQHGDYWLSESMAIIEYLEDVFPPPSSPRLLPLGMRERARARQVMSWLRTELFTLRQERSSWRIVYPSTAPPMGEVARVEAAELVEAAGRLIGRAKELHFAEWSMAHADLCFALMRLARTGYDLPAPVKAFVDAQLERASVAEYFAHPRPPNPPAEMIPPFKG